LKEEPRWYHGIIYYSLCNLAFMDAKVSLSRISVPPSKIDFPDCCVPGTVLRNMCMVSLGCFCHFRDFVEISDFCAGFLKVITNCFSACLYLFGKVFVLCHHWFVLCRIIVFFINLEKNFKPGLYQRFPKINHGALRAIMSNRSHGLCT